MEGLADVIARGGPVALIVAVIAASKYLAETVKSWKAARNEGRAVPMNDAATTNAMLLDALKIERSENSTLRARITELEGELDAQRDAVYRQRDEYEAEIQTLRRQAEAMTAQLDRLQASLAALGTPPGGTV